MIYLRIIFWRGYYQTFPEAATNLQSEEMKILSWRGRESGMHDNIGCFAIGSIMVISKVCKKKKGQG